MGSAGKNEVADDLPCDSLTEGGAPYPSLVDCYVCGTCAHHCARRDPEACWEAHEAWRVGKADVAFAYVEESAATPGQPVLLNGQPIPSAKRPKRAR